MLPIENNKTVAALELHRINGFLKSKTDIDLNHKVWNDSTIKKFADDCTYLVRGKLFGKAAFSSVPFYLLFLLHIQGIFPREKEQFN